MASVRGEVEEPVQIIKFTKPNRENPDLSINEREKIVLEVQDAALESILSRVGNRPLCILSICGPSRQGKSLMLGYMIRRLESLELGENIDWMESDNPTKPVTGFRFQYGTQHLTEGIWTWSRPFLVKNENGEEIAVLLVDTQGTNDENLRTNDMSMIVGLTLLCSSMTILNIFTNLQEDIIQALNTYIEFGRYAQETGGAAGEKERPFQNLTVLIRDWNFPGQHDYGDGECFLEEKLSVKEGHNEETRLVRENIWECFTRLHCYLLPHIGRRAVEDANFNGSISQLDKRFAIHLELFLTDLIQSGNLVTKKIFGEPINTVGFREMVNTYVAIFNRDEILPASMWDATVQLTNGNLVEKSVQIYRDIFEEKGKGQEYIPDKELEQVHFEGERQAMEHFSKARKFGGREKVETVREELQVKLWQCREEIKERNLALKEKFVVAGVDQAEKEVKKMLGELAPMSADDEQLKEMVFYPEEKIKTDVDSILPRVLNEFRSRIPAGEREEIVTQLMVTLEQVVEQAVKVYLMTNKVHRSNAEEFMEDLKTMFVERYRNDLKAKIEGKVIATEDLLGIHESCKQTQAAAFQEKKLKPGNEEFQSIYKTRLIAAMDKEFANQETLHSLHLKEVGEAAMKMIDEKEKDYREKIQRFVEGHRESDLEEMTKFHEESLEQFIKELENPFPIDSPSHTQIKTKLIEKMDAVFERINLQQSNSRTEMEKNLGESVEQCLQTYLKKADEAQETGGKMKDFEKIQATLACETLDQFDKAAREIGSGYPKTVEKYKALLETKMADHLHSVKNKGHYETCLKACEKVYEAIIVTSFDTARNTTEFQECHQTAKSKAVEALPEKWADTKLEGNVPESLKARLTSKLDESFVQSLKHFESSKRREKHTESTITALRNGRDFYKNEMEKYLENHKIVGPRDVEREHQKISALAVAQAKRQGGDEITPDLVKRLEKEIGKLLDFFKEKCLRSLNELKDVAIGIDLGTTNCCVSVFRQGQVEVIPNTIQQSNLIPSYVAFHHPPDGRNDTFGHVAKDLAYRFPEQTVYDAKRMIGRTWDDPDLQQDMQSWPFTVVNERGTPKIEVGGRRRFPHEISAKLLAKIRVLAEDYLKVPRGSIRKAVITVPAYFLEPQRRATVQAAQCAGLEVLTILNEPTAAAIAYNLKETVAESRRALIYDLGGGTFDVAIVHVTPNEIEVLSVAGDCHLGGQDFDHLLMNYCIDEFQRKERINLTEGKDSRTKNVKDAARGRMNRIKGACEKAKERLSSSETTTVELPGIHGDKRLVVEVTRRKLEELVRPLIQKTEKIMQKCLDEARRKGIRGKNDIDDVVVVGGSTRMPIVREMLLQFFKNERQLSLNINPDEAVAFGAAIQAAILNGKEALKHISVADVIPLPLGVEAVMNDVAGRFSQILGKNEKIPFENTERYNTRYDNQTTVDIKVFQGESNRAQDNHLLGEFKLVGLTPRPAEEEKFDITMEVNSMGILQVTAVSVTTEGIKDSITIQANRMGMDQTTMDRVRRENDEMILREPRQQNLMEMLH